MRTSATTSRSPARATTSLFLQCRPELRRCRVRFDVLIVRDGGVEWLRHAFDAC